MTFIKKSLSLNGHKPFHNIITNQQIAEIAEYNNILSLARHQAQIIIDNANLEANNIVSHANEQAQYILNTTNTECENKLQGMHFTTQNMLSEAEHQVQDILTNSEQKATQEVWNHASELINNLEQTHNKFYEHTHDLIKSILAVIIKKLTSNLEVQDRMQVIVEQVFAKAKEIEYATLFFSPKDFEHLPSFHIPQNWKLEKDNMLAEGLCRLVGAGGEWKTSITLIERKILETIDYNNDTSELYQKDYNQIPNTYELDNIEPIIPENTELKLVLEPELELESENSLNIPNILEEYTDNHQELKLEAELELKLEEQEENLYVNDEYQYNDDISNIESVDTDLNIIHENNNKPDKQG
jgi:F0F1-type ATP synthase membrane subunit b/b'